MEKDKDLKLDLFVNDQHISLNQFAETIIKNVLMSMVTSLKLDSEPEKIDIHLEQ